MSDETSFDGLAFLEQDGTTAPPAPTSVVDTTVIDEQPKEGETLVAKSGENANEYPSSYKAHAKRRPRITRKAERPPLLSPQEQRDLLDRRRFNLLPRADAPATKTLTVNLPLEVYARLVSMAESESMAGSLKHSFPYFLAWCILVGLKYYETYGLTHNNPDKIVFEELEQTSKFIDATQRMGELGHPDSMRRALEESVRPVAPIHPILGRMNTYPSKVEGGEQMVPHNPDVEEDYSYEEEARPGILEGRPAFDRRALHESVRNLLPASPRNDG